MVNLGLISADERGAERDNKARWSVWAAAWQTRFPGYSVGWKTTEHSKSYSSNTLPISPSFPPSHSTTPPSHTAVGHLCQRPLTAPPPTQRSHRSYLATPSLRRSRRRRSCSGRAQSAPSSSARHQGDRRLRPQARPRVASARAHVCAAIGQGVREPAHQVGEAADLRPQVLAEGREVLGRAELLELGHQGPAAEDGLHQLQPRLRDGGGGGGGWLAGRLPGSL